MGTKKRKKSSIKSNKALIALYRIGDVVKGRAHTIDDFIRLAGIDEKDKSAAQQRLKNWCEDGRTVKQKKEREDGTTYHVRRPIKVLHKHEGFVLWYAKMKLGQYKSKLEAHLAAIKHNETAAESDQVEVPPKPVKPTTAMLEDGAREFAYKCYENYEPLAVDGGERGFGYDSDDLDLLGDDF